MLPRGREQGYCLRKEYAHQRKGAGLLLKERMCSPEEGSRVTVKGKNMLPRGRKQGLKVYVNLSDLSLLPCQLHWSTVMVRGLMVLACIHSHA